ncbi:LptA/OstA family protein [Desulfovibrio sp. OttesenSCG-928-F20]|nr:LptA/OstA family protein [Desulfovibrio sp. OttesenSCG-928-M16]MDL2290598.1 LptA/OstA family protein [Desulfovibrio sp. OttesenSCG-928-F20]
MLYNRINKAPALFALLVLGCLLCSAPLQAALAAQAGKKVPTAITSAHMEYDANAQIVRFSGNVHVKRPDFELWSDTMNVYLDASSGSGQGGEGLGAGMEAGDIDRIVAQGEVRMKSEDKQGNCDKATYYAKEDRFVMEGSPQLKDSKQSTITGGSIVHYFSSNRSEVLNNAGVVFYAPDKTESAKNGAKKNGPALDGLQP